MVVLSPWELAAWFVQPEGRKRKGGEETVSGRGVLIAVGASIVFVGLAVRSLVAIGEGQTDWRNYWGGLVYAPVVLLAMILFVLGRKRTTCDASALVERLRL